LCCFCFRRFHGKMVSANGAPTGSPAMAAVAECVPPPLWSSPQAYTRIARSGQISVSQNIFDKDFISLLEKKKFLEKNIIRITYSRQVMTPSLNHNCSPKYALHCRLSIGTVLKYIHKWCCVSLEKPIRNGSLYTIIL